LFLPAFRNELGIATLQDPYHVLFSAAFKIQIRFGGLGWLLGTFRS